MRSDPVLLECRGRAGADEAKAQTVDKTKGGRWRAGTERGADGKLTRAGGQLVIAGDASGRERILPFVHSQLQGSCLHTHAHSYTCTSILT